MFSVTCPCGVAFEAARRNARWHSAACKKAHQRRGIAGPDDSPAPAPDPAAIESHGLVASVRLALEEHDKLNTVDGQIALQLARRLVDPDESGIASLAKTMRAALVAAGALTDAPLPAEPTKEPDEVARAREAREKARQARSGS